MTVKEAKLSIEKVLQDLMDQGILVRAIEISWSSEVKPEDKPVLDVKTICNVKFQADL